MNVWNNFKFSIENSKSVIFKKEAFQKGRIFYRWLMFNCDIIPGNWTIKIKDNITENNA